MSCLKPCNGFLMPLQKQTNKKSKPLSLPTRHFCSLPLFLAIFLSIISCFCLFICLNNINCISFHCSKTPNTCSPWGFLSPLLSGKVSLLCHTLSHFFEDIYTVSLFQILLQISSFREAFLSTLHKTFSTICMLPHRTSST